MHKGMERLLSMPSEVALRVMHPPWVNTPGWTGPERRKAPREASSVILDDAERTIVRALFAHGVHVTTLDEIGLPETDDMLAEATELSAEMQARSKFEPHRQKSILAANADDLLARPRLFHWGLNKRLLDIAEAYLRTSCAYDGVDFHYSIADGRATSTRVWHRDREDERQLKVILYVNDVSDAGGPFEIVRPEFQPLLEASLPWRYAKVAPADLDRLAAGLDAENMIRSCAGPRGTVIFVDTARCHHHGKPPTRDDRSALFFSYFSRRPAHPFCCQRSPISYDQLVALASSLPDRERACALWRDTLPIWSRLVPRNRMTVQS